MTFSGCTKVDDEETLGSYFTNGAGFLKMVSQSDNPYEIYIDDVLQGSIQGHGSKTYSLTAGEEHVIKVRQATGYLLYPTIESYNITLAVGQTYTKNFPVSSLGKSMER